jgi:hypothetical protein
MLRLASSGLFAIIIIKKKGAIKDFFELASFFRFSIFCASLLFFMKKNTWTAGPACYYLFEYSYSSSPAGIDMDRL